jgi:hypothetical protein
MRGPPAPPDSEPGGSDGDPGLGGGQSAVGEQGEPVAVGNQCDQGVDAGQQPAMCGWHGGSLRGWQGGAAAACHLSCRPESGYGDLWMTSQPELAAANPHSPTEGKATPC